MTGIGGRIAALFLGGLFRARLVRRLLLLSVVLFAVAMLDLPLPPGPLIDVLVLGAVLAWVIRRLRRRTASRTTTAPPPTYELVAPLDDRRT